MKEKRTDHVEIKVFTSIFNENECFMVLSGDDLMEPSLPQSISFVTITSFDSVGSVLSRIH